MARSPQGSAKKTPRKPWHSSSQAVDLQGKAEPKQECAIATAERILSTAEELLAEVGVERLSTNLICKRAGFTPQTMALPPDAFAQSVLQLSADTVALHVVSLLTSETMRLREARPAAPRALALPRRRRANAA